MQIDFEAKRGVVREGGGDYQTIYPQYVVGGYYEARLTFKHGCFKVIYFGESSRDIIEAALGAVQAFLDGEIYEHELWSDAPYSAKPGIQFGPMSSEIRNIIEQAIDLKTGGDRNKLTGLIALPG